MGTNANESVVDEVMGAPATEQESSIPAAAADAQVLTSVFGDGLEDDLEDDLGTGSTEQDQEDSSNEEEDSSSVADVSGETGAVADTPPAEGDEPQTSMVQITREEYDRLLGLERGHANSGGEPNPEGNQAGTVQDGQSHKPTQEGQKPPAEQPAAQASGIIEDISDDDYYQILDSPQAFREYEARKESARMRALTAHAEGASATALAQQWPFIAAAWEIAKAMPEYRRTPNIVNRALSDVIQADPTLLESPVDLYEKAVAYLQATSATVRQVADAKAAARPSQPAGPRATPGARQRPVSPTRTGGVDQALSEIARRADLGMGGDF